MFTANGMAKAKKKIMAGWGRNTCRKPVFIWRQYRGRQQFTIVAIDYTLISQTTQQRIVDCTKK